MKVWEILVPPKPWVQIDSTSNYAAKIEANFHNKVQEIWFLT